MTSETHTPPLSFQWGHWGLLWWLSDKEFTCNAGDTETRVQSLGWEDPLEEGMAIYSSILAWRTLWTEEPGGLQSTGHKKSDRTVGLNTHTRGHWSPEQPRVMPQVPWAVVGPVLRAR